MTTWSHPAFERVTRLVGAQIGLNVAVAGPDLETRVRRAMARTPVSDISEYARLLEAEALPLDDLLAEFTVGETYFFREPRQFEHIVCDILPEIVQRRGPAHHLRIWSAGCASGEEAYSLAIALEEAGLDGHVLATDISPGALRKARDATYRPWSLRGLDPERVGQYFDTVGNRWTLKDRYRRRVTFAFHNLVRSAYPSVQTDICEMDLILCRNVLIYLDHESVSRVAQRLGESLADGGWLIIGSSDPPLHGANALATLVTSHGLFYRKDAAQQLAPDSPEAAQASVETPPAHSLSPKSGIQPEARRQPRSGARAASATQSPRARTKVQRAREVRAEVRAAYRDARYERVLGLTGLVDDEHTAVLRVRAMANARGSAEASAEAVRLLERHPFSTELHLLDALLHHDLKRDDDAIRSCRRVLYLDRSLIVAHFLLASVLQRLGRSDGARRAYSIARDIASRRPADEALPLGDGERAGAIVRAAETEIARLEASQ